MAVLVGINQIREFTVAARDRARKHQRFLVVNDFSDIIDGLNTLTINGDVKPRLTDEQSIALDCVLRTLDIQNDYILGDVLRLAFGVELGDLQTPGRHYTERDLQSYGLTRTAPDINGKIYKCRYYCKSLYAKIRKAIRRKDR